MQKKDNHRKYYFDNTIFDVIDTSDKAYWIGFLYADGYITSQRGGFGIGLGEKDLSQLHKFCSFLSLDNIECIKYQEKTKSYRIQLADIHMYEELIKIGFTPNKSYEQNTTVIDNIPQELKKFFILGFWDGDGYVSISKEKKNLTGCVSKNQPLIEEIVSIINFYFGDNFSKILLSDGYPRIRLTTNKAKKFLDWLYEDSNYFLDRKYQTYLQFKKPDEKYNRPYKNINKLPSGNYFVKKTYQKKQYTIGTFSSIKEAVDAYNKKAEEIGFAKQKYIGEFLKWEEREE